VGVVIFSASPEVSVIMPVRNEQTSVANALASVLDQSFQDLEVIVADGRSEDHTADVVLQIAARDPRVRLVDNPAQTISHAMNTGLAHARGDFLVRVDAHAKVNRSYVERGVAELRQRPDTAAVGGQRIGVASTATGLAIATALSSPFGVGDSINHYATSKQETDHSSFGVYRADIVRAVGGWDTSLLVNEDVDIDHRILAAGHSIRYDPDMHIYWHVRESLRDFARQYRRYGRGKAAMVRKNGASAIRPRHLAAPALVTALAAAATLAVTGHRRLAGAAVAPYAAAVATATATAVTQRVSDSQRRVATLPLASAFVAMHVGWGFGFLEGLILRKAPVASSARPAGR
jgi:succinoglycan biosynthesis protein ExoA